MNNMGQRSTLAHLSIWWFPCCVIVDDVIDGLVWHLYASFMRRYPDICLGDHWSLVIYSLILQTNSSESLALVTVLFLRCIAISCAFVQIYFPEGVLLRLISRESVDWLIPTMSAISFLAVFFWSKAKICDLCSEINWWYICNTKLVNLWETSVSFFICIAGCFFFLSERCRQPLATRRERLHLSERDTLLLHFVLELAKD